MLEGMSRWLRAHPADPTLILTRIMLTVGGMFVGVFTAVIATGSIPLPGGLAVFAFLSAWMTGAWRFHRSDVYTNDAGIRIEGFLSTHILRWSTIAAVESRPARTISMQRGSKAIWIVPAEGPPIQTTLRRRATRFAIGHRSSGRELSPQSYDATLATLQRQLQSRSR